MLWFLYSIVELFVWDYRLREALTSNPIIHLTSSALNDILWIPIALALPIYIVLLSSRLIKRYVVKLMIIFVFIFAALLAMSSAHFYFRIMWLFSFFFFALWCIEIWQSRQIRVSLLFFAIALMGLIFKYNSQLLPRISRSANQSLTVLSFNFNTQMALDDQRTVQFIREKMPDIVFLQEFTAREKRHLLSKLSDIYQYNLLPSRGFGKNDVMILSRLKIIAGNQVKLKTLHSNGYASANHAIIEYQGENINVLNCHLSHPVRFVSRAFIPSDSSAYYFDLLNSADAHHREEARLLAEYMRNLEGPTILAGDFNDTPNSYVYHQFSASYQNAFATAGHGLGTTFGEWKLRQFLPTPLRPLALDYLRIDHIFCSNDFRIINARVVPLDAFDHRPQIITLELK